MKTRKHLFLIISSVYIIYKVFPMSIDILPLPVGAINSFTFVSLLILTPKAFANKYSLWALLYALILMIYTFTGKQLPPLGIGDYESWRIMVIELANILSAFAICQHLFYYNDGTLYRFLTYLSIIAILLSLIYVIPLAISNPYLLRKNEISGDLHTFGVPSYALTHAYMLLVAPLMYGLQYQRGLRKIGLLVFFVMLLFIIYNSYVSTTLILSLFAILFCLLYSDNNYKLVIRIGLVSFLIFIIFASGIIELLLDWVVDLFNDTATYNKMVDLRAMVLGQDIEGGVVDERANLHGLSWDAFGRNILIGSVPVGGHSVLIDRLGGLGLLGFIPFSCMMYSNVSCFYKVLLNKQSKFYYIISILVVVMYQYQKGLFGSEGWLFFFVLIPSYIYTFQSFQMSKDVSKQRIKIQQ